MISIRSTWSSAAPAGLDLFMCWFTGDESPGYFHLSLWDRDDSHRGTRESCFSGAKATIQKLKPGGGISGRFVRVGLGVVRRGSPFLRHETAVHKACAGAKQREQYEDNQKELFHPFNGVTK
jgi:hypothetical protein